jgi:hypothetical protein
MTETKAMKTGNSHPSIGSLTVAAFEHLFASSIVCVLSTGQLT